MKTGGVSDETIDHSECVMKQTFSRRISAVWFRHCSFKRSLPRIAHAQSLFGFSPMSAVAPLANPPLRVTSRVYFSRKARSDASKRALCWEDTSEGAGGRTAVGSNSSKRFLSAASPFKKSPPLPSSHHIHVDCGRLRTGPTYSTTSSLFFWIMSG